MAIDQNAAMAAIAAKALGQDPAAAQQAQPAPQDPAQAQAAQAQAAQKAAQNAPEKDTATDKAVSALSPDDASGKMTADPIVYEVEMGDGKKRKFTPDQIKGITDRYSSLNYKHAQYKPVLDIVEKMIESNPGASPEHVAQFMMNMLRGQQSNPQMGDQKNGDGRTNQQQPADVDPFAKWEEENASTLPPGYREMMQGNQGVLSQMNELKQMMAQVLSGSRGVADAARAGQQDAQQTQIAAVQRMIANNVDRAQQQLGLPDTEAENFMTFASERGYMLEDFADPGLTLKVMQDYKNTANSPEFERLAEISRRRQAWTGGPMPSAPAGPDGDPAKEGTGNTMFDGFAQKVIDRKRA